MGTRRTRMLAAIATREADLVALNTAYTEALTSYRSYKLDTGGAEQQMMQRQIKELSEERTKLEKEIDALYRKLEGRGITSLKMRRDY